MKILEAYSDFSEIVSLEDGRVITLSPLNLAGTRKMFSDSGLEIGVIQKLVCSLNENDVYILYLVTEDVGREYPSIYFEYMLDPGDIIRESQNEDYSGLLNAQDWIKNDPETLEIFQDLICYDPQIPALIELIHSLENKASPERKRRMKVIKKFVGLLENPDQRDLPKNKEFWQETGLTLLNHLGIQL